MITRIKKLILILSVLLTWVVINSCGLLNDIDIKRDYPKQFDSIEYSDDVLVLQTTFNKLVAIDTLTAKQLAVYDFTTKDHELGKGVHYKKHYYVTMENIEDSQYALLLRLNIETGKVDEIKYYNDFPELDSHARNLLLVGSPCGGHDTMLYDMETGKSEKKKTYASFGKTPIFFRNNLYVIDNTQPGDDELSWVSYTNGTRFTYDDTEYIGGFKRVGSENYIMMIQSNKRNQELEDNTIAIVGNDMSTGNKRIKYYKIINFENRELELIYDFINQGSVVALGVIVDDYAYLANDFGFSKTVLFKVDMATKEIVAEAILPHNSTLIYKNGFYWCSEFDISGDEGDNYYRVNPDDMSVVKFKIDESK
ncbi:MAG TPA: hypothetical protein P5123_05020 [Spirochaetota bacterium]|nr:hypothetical protein [Spirochaetota bacterium]